MAEQQPAAELPKKLVKPPPDQWEARVICRLVDGVPYFDFETRTGVTFTPPMVNRVHKQLINAYRIYSREVLASRVQIKQEVKTNG